MADLNYYLGPWQRDAEQNAWVPPNGTVGLLDFGSINDCALSPSAIDQRGIGLFCTPRALTLPSEYDLLDSGDCRDIPVTTAHINLVEAVLGVRIDAIGKTLDQACADLFGEGDPTGQERWKPLTPTREGAYEIHLGGHSLIHTRKFDGPADKTWNKLRDLLRHDLQEHDDECKAEAAALKDAAKELRKAGKNKEDDACDVRAAKVENHAEKVLDAMCRKYRCLPSELSRTIRRGKASTTISDSFSSSLTGWTAVSGTWSTVDIGGGNYRLRKEDNYDALQSVRNDTQLSSSDMEVEIYRYWSAYNEYKTGPCSRFSSSAATYYNCESYAFVGTELCKVVTGSRTQLGVNGTAATTGQPLKIANSGSTQTAYRNGTSAVSLTDTAISSGLQGGVQCLYRYVDGIAFDNFYATDGIPDAAGAPFAVNKSGNKWGGRK